MASHGAQRVLTLSLDPVFIQHFFLTYRRFASPRSVLLGMQKRMIQLSKETRDPLLAKFAQMRLVDFLRAPFTQLIRPQHL